MNKICCFITGGHKYKSSDLECKFDNNDGTVRFINRCDKCGKIYEVSIPQLTLFAFMMKEQNTVRAMET